LAHGRGDEAAGDLYGHLALLGQRDGKRRRALGDGLGGAAPRAAVFRGDLADGLQGVAARPLHHPDRLPRRQNARGGAGSGDFSHSERGQLSFLDGQQSAARAEAASGRALWGLGEEEVRLPRRGLRGLGKPFQRRGRSRGGRSRIRERLGADLRRHAAQPGRGPPGRPAGVLDRDHAGLQPGDRPLRPGGAGLPGSGQRGQLEDRRQRFAQRRRALQLHRQRRHRGQSLLRRHPRWRYERVGDRERSQVHQRLRPDRRREALSPGP